MSKTLCTKCGERKATNPRYPYQEEETLCDACLCWANHESLRKSSDITAQAHARRISELEEKYRRLLTEGLEKYDGRTMVDLCIELGPLVLALTALLVLGFTKACEGQ